MSASDDSENVTASEVSGNSILFTFLYLLLSISVKFVLELLLMFPFISNFMYDSSFLFLYSILPCMFLWLNLSSITYLYLLSSILVKLTILVSLLTVLLISNFTNFCAAPLVYILKVRFWTLAKFCLLLFILFVISFWVSSLVLFVILETVFMNFSSSFNDLPILFKTFSILLWSRINEDL